MNVLIFCSHEYHRDQYHLSAAIMWVSSLVIFAIIRLREHRGDRWHRSIAVIAPVSLLAILAIIRSREPHRNYLLSQTLSWWFGLVTITTIVCSCKFCCGQSNWQTVAIARTSCLWLMHLLVVTKVIAIGLVDSCVHAIFIAVEPRACSRSSSRLESIVCATIVAIKCLPLSSRSIKSFAIIGAVKLLVCVTFVAAELALSWSLSWLNVRDHLRDRKNHLWSSSRPNLKARGTIIAIELLCSRASLQSVRSFGIIIANKLDRSSNHCRDRTCSLAAILPQDTCSRSSSRRNLRGRATIVAIKLAHLQLSSWSRHSLAFIVVADLARSYQHDDCCSWTEQ